MPFSNEIKIEAMVACGRFCPICRKPCGNNMELHHIKPEAEGGDNSYDNAIPLCFDCHAEVGQYNSKHPKGIKFTEKELRQHRDNWYGKISESPAVISKSQYIEIDKKTYYTLNKFLPYNVISYLYIHGMGIPYKDNIFDEIEQFTEVVENPHYEYIDSDLEKAKMNLADSINTFFKDSQSCLFNDDGRVRVPPEWAITQPERFYEAVKLLNEDLIVIWEKYDSYIKICRRKLLI